MTRRWLSCGCANAICLFLALQPLAAAARHLASKEQSVVDGTAAVLSMDREDGTASRAVFVQTGSGERVQVLGSKQGPHAVLHTGMRVRVTGSWLDGAPAGGTQAAAAGAQLGLAPPRAFASAVVQVVRTARRPDTHQVRRPAKADPASSRVQLLPSNPLIEREVSTLVIPVSAVTARGGACPGTSLPKFTAAQVRRAVLQEANRNGTTVGGIFNQCSYGKSRLTEANSLVAPLVKLPCTGTSNKVVWSFNRCEFTDFYGWADAVDEVLRAQGLVLEKYAHRVYLMPPTSTCTFVGVGMLGCDGSEPCRAWMGGEWWASPPAIAHQLFHNLYLGHASAAQPGGVDEYGDATSGMGFCCEGRCPNTPQAWQMGWLTLQQLDSSSLKPGQTVQLRLASQAVSSQTGARIDVSSWVAGVDPIFVGFRTAERGDKNMQWDAAGNVHIYTAAIANNYDARPSMWQASLAAGQSWSQPASGVVVRYRGMAGSSALVSVCRRGGAETAASCAAGVDWDCNGLAGGADPACTSKPSAR